MEDTNRRGFFSSLSPKASFFVGLGSMIIVFFVVGFFVLLNMVLEDKKDGNNAVANTGAGTVAAGEVTDPNAPVELADVTEADWIRGKDDARITLVEYSDLECPFCKRFHETLNQLMATYPNDVRWVYRHYPLASLHPKAAKEAEATECAGEQGGEEAFWKYTDRLYEITPSNNGLDPAELPKIAEYAGLDVSRFNECLSSGKFKTKVDSQTNDAIRAGGQGTPYSVILVDNEKIPVTGGAVPFEQLDAFVKSVLSGTK